MAMVGNSITYGSGLANPSEECYPSQLSDMLSTVYGDTVLIENYGVSGRTMLKDTEKPIWDEYAFRQALEFVPDVCLILLGTNDSHPDYWNAAGENFLDDYLDMIDTFQFRNPNTKFLVCLPPPIFEGSQYGHDNDILENEIKLLIDSVAELTGATLIDFHTPFVDSVQLFPDFLHPDVNGAQKMGEILFNYIMDTELVHEVETGWTYIPVFKQYPALVQTGNNVELQWETIFADSVFLDGEPVDLSGSMEIVAEENEQHLLTAKGPYNTSEFPLTLWTYTVNSTTDLKNSDWVNIYPNPTSEKINIEVEKFQAEMMQINVFDMTGNILLSRKYESQSLEGSKFEINTSAFNTGTYIVEIISEKKRGYGRFIK